MIQPTSQATRIAAVALAALFLASCGGGGSSPSPSSSGPPPMLALDLIAAGFSSPLDLEQPDDGSGRLFVVEQGGKIRILQNGTIASQPFLDIGSKITTGGEMRLLGVTFHPNFAWSGTFYVNYDRHPSGGLKSLTAA